MVLSEHFFLLNVLKLYAVYIMNILFKLILGAKQPLQILLLFKPYLRQLFLANVIFFIKLVFCINTSRKDTISANKNWSLYLTKSAIH